MTPSERRNNAARIEATADLLAEQVGELRKLIPPSEAGLNLVAEQAQHGLVAIANYVAAFGCRS